MLGCAEREVGDRVKCGFIMHNEHVVRNMIVDD